jgi:undecaprenyl diphosphate synthase
MKPFPEAPAEGLEPRAPRHVGIIMDGNGRWAQARGLPRYEGHRRGVEAVRRAVRAAIDFGVSYLTIYSFSTENWSRPEEEVSVLMGLLKRFIRNDLADLHSNDVRVMVIGGRQRLAGDISGLLFEAEELTKANRGLTLVVAFNYGARQELVEAARRLAREAASGALDPMLIDETVFGSHHPHFRRTKAVELPALAGGLCGIRFSADSLARFRQDRVSGGARSIWATRTPLRQLEIQCIGRGEIRFLRRE